MTNAIKFIFQIMSVFQEHIKKKRIFIFCNLIKSDIHNVLKQFIIIMMYNYNKIDRNLEKCQVPTERFKKIV